MQCFYHPESHAVGTCKHCQRGLCRDCASEREGGLACQGRCEEMVDQVSALIRRNIHVGVKARPLSLVSLLVFGGGFVLLLYLSLTEDNPTVRPMLYLLTAFCFVAVMGQLSILRSWLARRQAREKTP
jgi:hypothetical protein